MTMALQSITSNLCELTDRMKYINSSFIGAGLACQKCPRKEVMTKTLEDYTKDELIDIIKGLKRRKKFGLVWEEKPEEVVKLCDVELPVLEELSKRAIVKAKDTPNNFMIEGDNYHSLSVLNYTHSGKMDVIYIDPPYNTGNKDFIYNDRYIDKEDTYRHSKWLSFMSVRLRLAKSLLSPDGVIFVSIDDNEQANLKNLMDEVFGLENYINTISIKAKPSAGASGGGEDKKLKKNIEYLLCYGGSAFTRFEPIYKQTDLMTYIKEMKDEDKSFKYTSVLVDIGKREYFKSIQDGSGQEIKIYKHTKPTIKSVAQLAREDGKTLDEIYQTYYEKIITTTNAQSSIRARVWDATGNENDFYSIEYVPKSGRNKGKLTTQYYTGKKKVLIIWLSDTAEKIGRKIYKKQKYGTFWDGINWNNVNKEGGMPFSNGKKPIELIQRLLKMHANKDAYVLDFFAGSGSTGHAVLAQNKSDGGKRRFFLCTNDESGIANETTYPRMKNVINGYDNTAALPANMRYFRTQFVSKQKTDDQTRIELVARSTEMICLREDTFEKVIDTKMFKVFGNGDHYAAILFEPEAIVLLKDALAKLKDDKAIHIYVFSLSNDTYESDFADLERLHELRPIPESILEVYRRIFIDQHESIGA